MEQRLRWPLSNSQTESHGKTAAALDQAVVDFCQVLLCVNEFVYVDRDCCPQGSARTETAVAQLGFPCATAILAV